MTVNKKKIKTLICILGQTRAQDITWDSFNKYLLKSLDADLALCIAEKKNKNNHMYKNAKYIWKYKDSDDYTKYFEKAQDKLIKSKKILTKPNWKILLKVKDFWLARIKGSSRIRSGTGGLLIYNRWFLLQNIIKENLIKKYDRFVITRSDFIWNIHHPRMSNLNSNYIWIPNEEKYGGYTDRHAILSRKNLYDYLNLIEPILLEPKILYEKMKSKKNWNLEKYIKFYLDQKGYSKKIRFFPYIMYSVRNNKIKTVFKPGRYSYKHKYFIKYFKEYLSSIIIYYFVGNKNKNYSNFNQLNFLYKIFKNLLKIRGLFYLFIFQKDLTKKFDKNFLIHNFKKKFIL